MAGIITPAMKMLRTSMHLQTNLRRRRT